MPTTVGPPAPTIFLWQRETSKIHSCRNIYFTWFKNLPQKSSAIGVDFQNDLNYPLACSNRNVRGSSMKTGVLCMLTILFSVLAPGPVRSTTIVALWTPEQVVIAADSLTRVGDHQLGGLARSSCKIVQVSNMFYALAGLPEDPETGFSAHDAVVVAARTPGKLIDKMKVFHTTVLPELRRALAHINAKYPASYQRIFKGRPVIDIIFAGVEDHSLAMVVMRIGLEDFAESGRILQYPNKAYETAFIGQQDTINRLVKEHPGWTQGTSRDPIKIARMLVETQISENPETVGPPVDILSIGLRGSRWIQRKPECPEIMGR